MKVLVVCTANICRSPYAAAALAQRLPALDVCSAGVQASSGRAVDAVMAGYAVERGYRDLSTHRSQPVLAALLRACDLVLCMERAHRDILLGGAPMMTGIIRTFLDSPARDVADPTGLRVVDYAQAVAEIEAGIDVWAERIRRIGPL